MCALTPVTPRSSSRPVGVVGRYPAGHADNAWVELLFGCTLRVLPPSRHPLTGRDWVT